MVQPPDVTRLYGCRDNRVFTARILPYADDYRAAERRGCLEPHMKGTMRVSTRESPSVGSIHPPGLSAGGTMSWLILKLSINNLLNPQLLTTLQSNNELNL